MRYPAPRRLYGAPRVYGAPVMNGACCARKNGGDTDMLVGLGAIALIGIVGWVITKPQRDAKIAKDLAVAQALREGKVDNLSLAQTEANVTGYGMNF